MAAMVAPGHPESRCARAGQHLAKTQIGLARGTVRHQGGSTLTTTDGIERAVAALRRLHANGGHANLYRTATDRLYVRVSGRGARAGDQTVQAIIELNPLGEIALTDADRFLRQLGWSFETYPTLATKPYVISSDADLVRIATDAHTALDFLLPDRFGEPLDGARFGPYADSQILFWAGVLGVAMLLLGLVVGSVVLFIWFRGDWEAGPAWGAAILGVVLGAYVVPAAIVRMTTGSSDRLHDAAQAVQQIGSLVLPGLIAAIVLVVATVVF